MRSTAECVNSYIMSDVDNDTDVSSGIMDVLTSKELETMGYFSRRGGRMKDAEEVRIPLIQAASVLSHAGQKDLRMGVADGKSVSPSCCSRLKCLRDILH